jgi:hypothetical protein
LAKCSADHPEDFRNLWKLKVVFVDHRFLILLLFHRHLVLGRLLMGLTSLPCGQWPLKKYCQLKQVHLPCHPACLVSPPALSAHLPCQPACLVSLPALSAGLPCQPVCLVSPPALSACLPCQPACLVSPPALSAHLLCFVPTTIAPIGELYFFPTNTLSNLLYLDIYMGCFIGKFGVSENGPSGKVHGGQKPWSHFFFDVSG